MKTVTRVHMSAFPSLSGRGLRPSSKSGTDWLEACVVPLPATGGPGQIRSAPPPSLLAPVSALYPFSSACILSGHLKPSQGVPVQPGGLRRWLFYNGVKEAQGVWGQGVSRKDRIRRHYEWVRKFCEVEQRGLCTQDALVQGRKKI